MRTAALLLAVTFVSSVASIESAQAVTSAAAQSPQDQPGLSEQEGLRTMRVLLSAQLSRPAGETYVPLVDALRYVPGVPRPAQTDAGTVAFKGYLLRMTLSADRRHFQASLTPESGCGKSWFSNEQGLIYVGRVLDCATD